MIDLTVNKEKLKNAVEMAKKRNVLIPTFKQMRDPEKYTPVSIRKKLKKTGLWDVDPAIVLIILL